MLPAHRDPFDRMLAAQARRDLCWRPDPAFRTGVSTFGSATPPESHRCRAIESLSSVSAWRDAARQEPARSAGPRGGRLRHEPDGGAPGGVRGPLSLPHRGQPRLRSWRIAASTRWPSSRRPTRTWRSRAELARAGKHVLLEKPLDVSTARAERLVAACGEAGVTLGVVLQHRFKPAAERLAAILRDRRAGRDRQLLDQHPAVAAAELLRRAGPRHQGARRRRRAAHPGHPHARPDAEPRRRRSWR